MSYGLWPGDFCVTEQAFSEFIINRETTNHTVSYNSVFLMKNRIWKAYSFDTYPINWMGSFDPWI